MNINTNGTTLKLLELEFGTGIIDEEEYSNLIGKDKQAAIDCLYGLTDLRLASPEQIELILSILLNISDFPHGRLPMVEASLGLTADDIIAIRDNIRSELSE